MNSQQKTMRIMLPLHLVLILTMMFITGPNIELDSPWRALITVMILLVQLGPEIAHKIPSHPRPQDARGLGLTFWVMMMHLTCICSISFLVLEVSHWNNSAVRPLRLTAYGVLLPLIICMRWNLSKRLEDTR